MKILNLSLDSSIIDKASAAAGRGIEYGNLVEKYIVVAPSQIKKEAELSERVKVYGSGGAGKIRQLFYLYRIVKKLLQEERYDVITAQDQYYLALAGFLLSKKFRVALEVQVHGFEKCQGLRKLIAEYVLPRANAVRCVSQRLKKQLTDSFGIVPEKITVVPIYSEKSQIPNPKSQNLDNATKDKFIFLAVGRLVPVKNIGLQIEAMEEIIKKHLDAELWIVGDGPEWDNLKFKIENLKLSSSVRLLGQKTKEELKGIYNEADVFLLTSNSEGWGLVAVEAASFGLPIIMTDVGCAGEVIINNESGIIIPAGDKVSLIRAMEEIIRDNNLRQILGEGARRAAEALPSKQETLDLYLASWRRAAGQK